jgi:hypothetical protein
MMMMMMMISNTRNVHAAVCGSVSGNINKKMMKCEEVNHCMMSIFFVDDRVDEVDNQSISDKFLKLTIFSRPLFRSLSTPTLTQKQKH